MLMNGEAGGEKGGLRITREGKRGIVKMGKVGAKTACACGDCGLRAGRRLKLQFSKSASASPLVMHWDIVITRQKHKKKWFCNFLSKKT